jgi:outer membrane protein assembly factor BamB
VTFRDTAATIGGAMMPMVRRIGAVAAVAMTLMLAASPSLGLSGATAAARFTAHTSLTATPTTSVPIVPVKVQVVAKGQFSGLVSGGGWLYSVELPERGSQVARAIVVRFDPASGHIVARSAVLPGASSPTFVDNALWLIAGLSKGRGLPTVLVALNPLTLRRERSVPVNSSLASGALDSLTGSGRGPLWAALGCKLLRLDPEYGQVLQAVTVRAGTQCEIAMDTGTNRLLVEVGPTALRGQPPAPTLLLQERNGSNGRLLGSAIIPNPPNGWDWLSAYDGNVWLSGGDPGTCGSIYDYRTSPLRLFASSHGQECADLPVGVDGGPGASLPHTSQFPLVDISGGVVWVASDGGVDCFNPRTARFEAFLRSTSWSNVLNGPIVVTRDGTYGVAASVQPGLGIMRLTPPVSCRP